MNSFVQQTSPLGCCHTAKRHTLTFADLESKWIPLRDPQPVYVIDNIAIALSFWGKTHTALVVHPYMTLNPDKPWICNLDHLFNLIEGFVYLFMPIYFYLKNAKHLDYRYMKKALIQSLTDTLSMYDAFCRSQFLAKGRLTSHWQAWVTVPIWDLIMWRGIHFEAQGNGGIVSSMRQLTTLPNTQPSSWQQHPSRVDVPHCVPQTRWARTSRVPPSLALLLSRDVTSLHSHFSSSLLSYALSLSAPVHSIRA